MATKDIVLFSLVSNQLRSFFINKGFIEMHSQDRLSILAACEDPSTIATYQYAGEEWPLPQTGQMWLEYELLSRPNIDGIFCVSTSYRNEKNPIPGRHEIIFPMFEFESRGNFDDLLALEEELCEHMGLGNKESFIHADYRELALEYGTEELTSEHEKRMHHELGTVVFLKQFPYSTSPFWNMKRNGDTAQKTDVILFGTETIGSAERASDKDEMREQFYSISDGLYAETLFRKFSKERVEVELEDFLSFDFFPRFGGGVGMTRMMNAISQLR